MSGEIDPKIAERLSFCAISLLLPSRGDKILCTRGVLKKAILQVAQEAYEIGFLAGQKEQLVDSLVWAAWRGLLGRIYDSMTRKAWQITKSDSSRWCSTRY
jgi:hypothetical protein